ncbi:MAG TPA: tetratricopeptide repeat protein [Bacteroidales bacterium]|nr:tetratricopeptide repeat protein [Bacteroidales bacterium]
MKTKGFKILFIAISAVFLAVPSYSQDSNTTEAKDTGDWKNNETCLKNLSLYYEFYKHKNYDDAISPWRVVYRECPESRESLYAYGVNMYRHFLDRADDPAVKSAYADTMMMIYDKRMEYFPDSRGDVLGRKGVDLLRYKRQEGEKFIKEGYDLLKESIDIEKTKSNPVVLTTFISAAITLFANGELDNETVINDYMSVSKILDTQLAKRPTSRTKLAKEAIDKNIKDAKVLTCDAINTIFGPKYDANKDDEQFLDRILGFMTEAGCEDQELYIKASEQLYTMKPSAESAYNLARLFLKKEEFDKAKKYYLEAIEKATSDDKKANYYYELGAVTLNMNNPQEAANYAGKAIDLKPDWGEPYILLGKSYVSGNNSLGDEFERRTAYWIAVDMFRKAKAVDPTVAPQANQLISDYRQYFPTKEELFFRSISEGDSYTVGGWINRTTTARAKS